MAVLQLRLRVLLSDLVSNVMIMAIRSLVVIPVSLYRYRYKAKIVPHSTLALLLVVKA